jgi:hypothetical protein
MLPNYMIVHNIPGVYSKKLDNLDVQIWVDTDVYYSKEDMTWDYLSNLIEKSIKIRRDKVINKVIN